MPKKRKDRLESAGVDVEVIKLFEAYGWFWWRPKASMFGKSGISDFHAAKDGMFMVVEDKNTNGNPKPTANQIAFLQAVRAAKHFAFVVDRSRLVAFETFLRSMNQAQAAAMREETIDPVDGASMLDAIRLMQQEF
jgi:hypothetical protein